MGNTPTRTSAKTKLPKLIEQYYAELKELAHQNVMFEMGTRHAFHTLLAGAGKEPGWTLIAEQEKKVNGKTIRPDGTFKDAMNLVRGFWEAKDTDDDLEAEIEKKRKAGYPLSNIIFEDNATAVLYQHGMRVLAVDMKDPGKLAELITEFFRYTEPEIEEFEQAINEFKERVPDLAVGLGKKIDESHRTNPAFKKAFADFFELCRTSLNPNLSQAAVDEMLIQHILTERLIREIFDNPEFVRRNVIAAEVEKVMQAMTSQSFDRNTYLKELDRFYVAIERAARTMTDFSDKQHFLNTVYERFFQGYSVKLADTMGIVYTPQEIVDFMCASVAEVLEKEFGKHLWDDEVFIIDPCTGTGNFIVNLIRRMPKKELPDVYKHRLFANEVMLLPYYIAALNIEHAYYEQTGRYESFEGLCFVDTLDLAEHAQAQLGFMTAKNSERVDRQRRSPITVVIGNPPYNANQANENDDNKNRSYDVIDTRIKDTYVRRSSARKTKSYDPYIRFFRWATDRLGDRDGIVCYVTNNSFVHQTASDGLQRLLPDEFTSIYHLDMRGNVRQNPTLSGTAYNVFGIQVGVGITIAVRRRSSGPAAVRYAAIPLELRRANKLQWLASVGSCAGVKWASLKPDAQGSWFQTKEQEAFSSLLPLGDKDAKGTDGCMEALFDVYSLGVVTNRDDHAYSFDATQLSQIARGFIDRYLTTVDKLRRRPAGTDVKEVINIGDAAIKWTRQVKKSLAEFKETAFCAEHIRRTLYRPFTRRWLYFDDFWNEEQYRQRRIFPTASVETENRAIALTAFGSEKPFMVIPVAGLCDLHLVGAGAGTMCFPFYTYDEDGSNRKENITDWALKEFRTHYKDKKIDKWAIFHYVYGMLHHPGYREKFADNLKRELPRIPFAPLSAANALTGGGSKTASEGTGGTCGFWAFSKAGKELAGLHLDYEKLEPWELEFVETPAVPLSYRVEDKMRLGKDKSRLAVNKSLTLAGIPAEAFDYRLGNRSALEWVIDQYQVYTDARSGITSDPNREDDPEYIVRLVGQVIRVSVETVRIVKTLPAEYAEATGAGAV
ncbi:MAG: type ISP restriction/modification enzyme [Tepidisphaeraceae bacterium]